MNTEQGLRIENENLKSLLEQTERERDEALAYGYRLRTVARGLIADCEEAVFNDENVFCVNQDVVSDLEDSTEEQPHAALAALKAELQAEAVQSILDGCEHWSLMGTWGILVEDISEKLEGLYQRAHDSGEPCAYPDCRCPIDLPHKDSPCAIGRKKGCGDE